MNLKLEKEKIKRELDKIDDVRIINGIKWFIDQYDPNDVPGINFKGAPIADWEMATPMGRTPTSKQLEEWLDKEDPDDKGMSVGEAVEYMKKLSEKNKQKWK